MKIGVLASSSVANPDRAFTAPDGSVLTLKGRALLWIRNVGHLMTNPAILLPEGSEIPEGLMDAMITRSDNRATDLLMNELGGPGAVDRWLRAHDLTGIRVDRTIARVELPLGSPLHHLRPFSADQWHGYKDVRAVPRSRRLAVSRTPRLPVFTRHSPCARGATFLLTNEEMDLVCKRGERG